MIRLFKRSVGHGCAGFTLVELLIVVAIIAVLLAILLPVLAIARENAWRAVCASHLHNNGNALTAYALDHDGRLPVFVGPSSWLWDMPLKTRDVLVASGMVRDCFYCPSGSVKDDDGLWNFKGDPFPYCVSGYFWLMPRSPAIQPLFLPKVYIENIKVPDPSDVEIVTDATVADGVSQQNNFTGIFGGDTASGVYFLNSNHLRTKDATKAAGGNILFIDGHVAWRDIGDMHAWFNPASGIYQWF